jgi:hypothetical protein
MMLNNLAVAIGIKKRLVGIKMMGTDWVRILVKAFSVLVVSLIGLAVGAFVLYFTVGLIYTAVFGSGPARNSYECARGMAIGWLSLFAGALMGFCIGAFWGYRFFRPGEDIRENLTEP